MNDTFNPHQSAYSSSDPSTPPQASTERTWAVLCHLSLIISAVLSLGLLAFVGPLIFWFLYKDRSDFVRNAAAGSFNFAVTLTLASMIASALAFTVILLPISWVIWAVVYVAGIVVPIIAALAAGRYEKYRYPLTLPLLK